MASGHVHGVSVAVAARRRSRGLVRCREECASAAALLLLAHCRLAPPTCAADFAAAESCSTGFRTRTTCSLPSICGLPRCASTVPA